MKTPSVLIKAITFGFYISLCLALSPAKSFAAEFTTTQVKALNQMEVEAKTIVETLLTKNTETSRQHYNQLTLLIHQLQNSAREKQYNEKLSRELMMAYSWLRIIDIEAARQAWVEAAIGANQLTGMNIQASNFPTMMERDLEWLDYLGRDIQLLMMEDPHSNADLLKFRKADMSNTWERVSAALIENFKNKPLVLQGKALESDIIASTKPDEIIAKSEQWLTFIRSIEDTGRIQPGE